MPRPRTVGDDAINASIRISKSDWERLEVIAQSMGKTKAELLRAIAKGEIPLGGISSSEIRLLGKSFSASTN